MDVYKDKITWRYDKDEIFYDMFMSSQSVVLFSS